jgi:hypothetical protein
MPVTVMVISKPTVMLKATDMHKLTDTDKSLDIGKLMHSIKRLLLATDLDLELTSLRKPRMMLALSEVSIRSALSSQASLCSRKIRPMLLQSSILSTIMLT